MHTPARKKYRDQKLEAQRRNIPFLISYEEWLTWWLSHGVDKAKPQPTFNGDTLVMCRFNDVGPYHLDNIYVDTVRNNVISAYQFGRTTAHRRKALQTPEGLFESKTAAVKHYKVDSTTIANWIKRKPSEFYYI